MQIHGFNKLTLLDYPDKLSALIFTGGCNMRCPFCHNASLVLNPGSQPLIPEDEVLSALKNRRSLIEGVCITGGEPTLQKDLKSFIKKIKELGLLVKLDTNGTCPQTISDLISEGLIDYAAIDIKAAPENYHRLCGVDVNMEDNGGRPGLSVSIEDIKKSAGIVMASDIDYEFRTTVVQELHDASDFDSIGRWLCGARAYYLQAYKDSGDILGGCVLHSASRGQMEDYKSRLLPYIENVGLRGL